MARLSKKELDKIVSRDLPGYTVVSRGEGGADKAPGAEPDEVAPGIDELRRKYLGEGDGDAEDSAGDDPAPGAGNPGPEENTDDEIVTVKPKSSSGPFDHSARPKTIVVSGKDRRVIGSQG